MPFRLMVRVPRSVVAAAGCAMGLFGGTGMVALAADAVPRGTVDTERPAVQHGGAATSRFFGQAWQSGPSHGGSTLAAKAGPQGIGAPALPGPASRQSQPLRFLSDIAPLHGAVADASEGGAATASVPPPRSTPDSDVTQVSRAGATSRDASSHEPALWGAQALAAWRSVFAPAGEPGTVPVAPAGEPTVIVAGLHQVVLDVGRHAETLGFQGRRQRLDPAIRDSFDLAGMAQFAVGEHWQGMSDAQQQALIESFSRILVAMFADRFDFYYNHKFETVNTTTHDHGAVRVNTDLVLPIGHRVRIAYVLRPVAGRWRIIDVLPPPGYSEAFARREEYLSVINRRGINGFFAALEVMVASLESR